MGFSLLVYLVVIALARTGRVAVAAIALVLLSTIGAALAVLGTPGVTEAVFFLVLPVLIAELVLRPWQVWGAVLASVAVVATKAAAYRADLGPGDLGWNMLVSAVLIIMSVGIIGFIGARIMRQAFAEAAQAQLASEQAARQLAVLNAGLEGEVAARMTELQQALTIVEARAAEKQLLLDELATQRVVLREMSVPVLPISAKMLVLPLVGALDSDRLEDLRTQALGAVERFGARTLLLDITGVLVVDTEVAQGLVRTIQATRLLGAEPVLVGVRPEVAQAIVSLGVDLAGVRFAATLASALRM
jgi:rsbT co-antagonist protein RsbR